MFWKDYTGSDATLEILIMLLGAFLLGAALMYFYDKYFFECVDDEDEVKNDTYHKIMADGINEEEKSEFVVVDAKKDSPKIKENIMRERNEVGTQTEEDDLKIIEGIGPKIESILKSKEIRTLDKLSETSAEEIKDILTEVGGERYAFHDPTTWADQAKLAAEGKINELTEYQSFLRGGKI